MPMGPAVVLAVVLGVFVFLNVPFAGLFPLLGPIVGLATFLLYRWSRGRGWLGLAGAGCLGAAALYIVTGQLRHDYLSDFSWPQQFTRVHVLGLLGGVPRPRRGDPGGRGPAPRHATAPRVRGVAGPGLGAAPTISSARGWGPTIDGVDLRPASRQTEEKDVTLDPKPTPEPCLSVVMPCFNEIGTIESVLERVLASPYTEEVVVVDDGSTDGTREVLAKVDDPRVRVLPPAAEPGQGRRAAPGVRRGHAPLRDRAGRRPRVRPGRVRRPARAAARRQGRRRLRLALPRRAARTGSCTSGTRSATGCSPPRRTCSPT